MTKDSGQITHGVFGLGRFVFKDGEDWKYRGKTIDYDDFFLAAEREDFQEKVRLLCTTRDEFSQTKDFLEGGISWSTLSKADRDRWTSCFKCLYSLPAIIGNENFSQEDRDFLDSEVIGWFFWRCLEYLRLRVESGDGLSILDAVSICGMYSIPLPPWAANEFCGRWASVCDWESKTLEDAFGQSRRKSMATDSERRIRAFGGAAAKIVAERKAESNQPIDELMFEDVSIDLGGTVPPSTLRKWYRRAVRESKKWFGREPI